MTDNQGHSILAGFRFSVGNVILSLLRFACECTLLIAPAIAAEKGDLKAVRVITIVYCVGYTCGFLALWNRMWIRAHKWAYHHARKSTEVFALLVSWLCCCFRCGQQSSKVKHVKVGNDHTRSMEMNDDEYLDRVLEQEEDNEESHRGVTMSSI